MKANLGRSDVHSTAADRTQPFLHLATRDDEIPSAEPAAPRIRFPDPGTGPAELEIALRQRVKELNCLYGICHLIRKNGHSIHGLIQDVVDLLPSGWQYDEVACARIVFYGKTFCSDGFRFTQWHQSEPISIYDSAVGEITVCYREERPLADEGPFLAGQRLLLSAVAEQISHTVRRVSANIELKEMGWRLTVQQQALQEANAALRALVEQAEEEKREICRNAQENLERVVTPMLNALASQMSSSHRRELAFLRRQLKEATSPFTRRLTQQCVALTPSEIEICNFIRSGLRTKEIAEMRGVSVATINRHREHIRRKLGIAHSDANLTSYLQSAVWEQNGSGGPSVS